MKVCEIFKSIQGEGPEIGTPTLFIRLSGCNSFCDFCDTKYSWKEGKEMGIDELIKKIKTFNINHITWTGGEPTLQIEEIRHIIKVLGYEYKHSIETNGSLVHDMLQEFSCVVVSPKRNLKEWFIPLNEKTFIKMVCSSKEDVEGWVTFMNNNKLNKEKCYFMPEGKTEKEIKKNSKWLIEECKKYNIKYSPRLHIMLWGRKRGK